jgi:hypothetical protein
MTRPMTKPQDDATNIVANGIAVERRLLESRPLRRCQLHECHAHCCSCGVYLTVEDARKVLAHEATVLPHMPVERRDSAAWFDWNLEPDDDHPQGGTLASTNVAPDATHPAKQSCVFLRPDRKCALQVASIANGQHPWHLKPFYCALYPLVFHEHQLILDDENLVYLEDGTCTRPACGGESVPLYRLLEVEMKLALGETGYAEFVAKAGHPA